MLCNRIAVLNQLCSNEPSLHAYAETPLVMVDSESCQVIRSLNKVVSDWSIFHRHCLCSRNVVFTDLHALSRAILA